jgi:hypothetical protein
VLLSQLVVGPKSHLVQSLLSLRNSDFVARIKSDILMTLRSSAARKAALRTIFLMLPPATLNWAARNLKMMSTSFGARCEPEAHRQRRENRPVPPRGGRRRCRGCAVQALLCFPLISPSSHRIEIHVDRSGRIPRTAFKVLDEPNKPLTTFSVMSSLNYPLILEISMQSTVKLLSKR